LRHHNPVSYLGAIERFPLTGTCFPVLNMSINVVRDFSLVPGP
jgi:hypothetical protein